MRIELLKNIAEIIAGQSPPSETYNNSGEGIPFFQGMADYGEKFPVVRSWCLRPTKISQPNDILISVRAPVGPVNINNVEACIGRGLSAVRANKNYSYEYIYYFLKTNERQIANLGVGSTFKAITQKELGNIKISVPDTIYDQIKIATVLSKAEALIKQRLENIALLDEFLKSNFLKMFGDPVMNEKGWEKKKVGDVIDAIRYGTGTPPEYQLEGIPFIRATNIKNGRITEKGMVFISDDEASKIEKCRVRVGDLLVVRSGANTGDAATIPKEYDNTYAGYDLILNLNPITSVFYNELINSSYGKTKIKPLTQRSGQPHLNAEQVKNLEFYFPPIELQKEFALVVERTESLKEQLKNSLNDLEKLFGSLSQRAFKGELDLSGLVIDHINSVSQEGTNDISNLQAISEKENIKKADKLPEESEEDKRHNDQFNIDEETAKNYGAIFYKEWKEHHKIRDVIPDEIPSVEKYDWKKSSASSKAIIIRERYWDNNYNKSYCFSPEMLYNFLQTIYGNSVTYYTTKELIIKRNLNEEDTLKHFIDGALHDAHFPIKFEQLFYDAENENFNLELLEDDSYFLSNREKEYWSGIYFKIQ